MAIIARLRTNEQIRVSEVRLIDEAGQQLGVVGTEEALNRAREAGLDLVEVAPRGVPPVCRIIDYGKWRYERQKKEHQSRKKQHVQELKEIRVRPKTDRHDLQIKLNHAKEFLDDGCKVQITMIFRGRERLHRDRAIEIFRNIAMELEEFGKIERDGHFEGRRMIMILSPQAKKELGKSKQTKARKSEEKTTSAEAAKVKETTLPEVIAPAPSEAEAQGAEGFVDA